MASVHVNLDSNFVGNLNNFSLKCSKTLQLHPPLPIHPLSRHGLVSFDISCGMKFFFRYKGVGGGQEEG